MRFAHLVFVWLLLALALPAHAQDDSLVGPDVYPPGVNPLTGLEVADPELLNRRPVIVKISNHPAVVRPQSGLNSADVVWEHVTEGGTTRFSAIFYGEDVPHVGPVRSARLVDIPLTRIYNALFIHSGSSQGTRDYLRRDPEVALRNVGGGECPPLCRFQRDGVAYEHTLFGDTAAMYVQAANLGMDLTPEPVSGMAFSETPPSGTPIEGVDIAYRQADIGWEYDETGGWWTRTQDGEPHYDAFSGAQVRASNVLILEADHIDQPYVSEGYWGAANYATQPVITGSGRVYLLRDGVLVEGEWRRATDDDPLTFYDLAGNVLPFKPGNTFVNLMPRWFNGYQLVFDLIAPPPATVTTNAVLRLGPSTNYNQAASLPAGSSVTVSGRNGAGDWVQVVMDDSNPLWMSASVLSLTSDQIAALPDVRSTFEG